MKRGDTSSSDDFVIFLCRKLSLKRKKISFTNEKKRNEERGIFKKLTNEEFGNQTHAETG